MTYIAHLQPGKKIQRIEEHLLNVANICGQCASKIGAQNVGEIIGLLHDVGKYSDIFQRYIQSAAGIIDQDADDFVNYNELKGKIDHSSAGAQLIWKITDQSDQKKKISAQLISLCIASHHSGLIDCITPDGENEFSNRINKKHELTYLPEIEARICDCIVQQITDKIKRAEEEIIQHLQSIYKSCQGNNIIASFQAGLLARMLFSCLLEGDRLDTADFENPQNLKSRQYGDYIGWEILIDRLEYAIKKVDDSSVKDIKINSIRKLISNECHKKGTNQQGIYTLTVPTGGGKTLSSLRFALHHAKKHNLDRIIYVIPYTTIIEQNAKVAREILELSTDEKGKIVLEHHTNLLPQNYTWKNKILSENWDAPIVFTTMVQFLETLFGGGTRYARRMHQLARSIIIFDEIQTLPVKTVHLFNNAINYLVNQCNTTAVLCTATQPLLNAVDEKKGKLNLSPTNEIVTDVPELYNALKRVNTFNKIINGGWSSSEIAEFSLSIVHNTSSCLIVVNTKSMARNIYDSLINNDIPVFHLSTSMCPAHRSTVLAAIKELLRQETPVLCVSTQLIEAGVDIDFNSVIRSVAGLDSIVQAAGRCNRNGTKSNANVYIINPNEEVIDSLTDIKTGKDVAERILRETSDNQSNASDIIHPDLIKRYFQYYFYDRATEMDYKISDPRNDTLLNLLGENTISRQEYYRKYGSNAEILFFNQAFRAGYEEFKAIDSSTVGIVVPYEDGKEIISELFSQFALEKSGEIIRKAQRYSVSVFPNILDKLKREGVIREVPEIGVLTLSDESYYHEAYGLCLYSQGKHDTLLI